MNILQKIAYLKKRERIFGPRQDPPASRFYCPVCDHRHDGYLPLPESFTQQLATYGFDAVRLQMEFLNRQNILCPCCGAMDRERISAEYLLRRLGDRFFAPDFRFLEFAPSPAFNTFLHNRFTFQHETADLLRPGVDHRLDLTHMPEMESESVDAWISLHMLEHIPDDAAALRELFRILKPAGFGLLMVPLSLALETTDEDPAACEAERWRRFGQADHIRTYAKKDFLHRVKAAGFAVHQLDREWFGSDCFMRLGLPDRGVLYLVEKHVQEHATPGLPPSLYDCLEHPKTCAPDDFLGQVRRTVKGKPISPEQLSLIRSMIRDALQFRKEDCLLDLCCGNGFLASAFFDDISQYLGVDLSPCLIDVANRNFKKNPDYLFLCQDLLAYCKAEIAPDRFTTALWYGAFAYFTEENAFEILSLLHKKFISLRSLFIGAIPDRTRLSNFTSDVNFPVNDPASSIGFWYRPQAFIDLATKAGWNARLTEMPASFYQAPYRFNALLRR